LHGVERAEVVPWWAELVAAGRLVGGVLRERGIEVPCGRCLGFLLSGFPAGEGGLGDGSDWGDEGGGGGGGGGGGVSGLEQ